MIVLDEELQGLGLEEAISAWYRGSVILIKALRPGTVIKDEAIPSLLRQAKLPTFITINKVVLVSPRVVQYYGVAKELIHILGWPAITR